MPVWRFQAGETKTSARDCIQAADAESAVDGRVRFDPANDSSSELTRQLTLTAPLFYVALGFREGRFDTCVVVSIGPA